MRILLNAGESDGAVGVVEMTLGPGAAGPPLHVHPTHAEASGVSFFAPAG